MAIENQIKVIENLKVFLKGDWIKKAKKKNPDFASKIEALKAEDIYFGNCPSLNFGYASGNYTAVGESTYGNTKTQRTISADFTTDSFAIIMPKNKADMETCKAALRILPYISGYKGVYKVTDTRRIAEEQGRKFAKQSLSDLNFSMKEYRLNRDYFNSVKPMDNIPIWPIFGKAAGENGKADNVRLGYYWRDANGQDQVTIEIKIPLTKTKRLILGIIAAIVVVAIIIGLFL